ncbi:phage holin family protein [Anatilimnocola sp. NA78]|uniref:phage holin family protein n=1 Tax=Anatilimnocola sp. NA78 TaxID=3415683 RepID=UPI003CE45E80
MATDLRTDYAEPGSTAAPSMTHLVSGIIADAQELMKQQLALFRTEVKEDVRKTKAAVIALVTGLALASVGGTLLCFMFVYALEAATELPLWGCFGIVGGLLAAGGGIAFYGALRKFNEFNPLPDESARALKENVQWITQQR